jgi:tetratricopeptide (TPR) repeat protein
MTHRILLPVLMAITVTACSSTPPRHYNVTLPARAATCAVAVDDAAHARFQPAYAPLFGVLASCEEQRAFHSDLPDFRLADFFVSQAIALQPADHRYYELRADIESNSGELPAATADELRAADLVAHSPSDLERIAAYLNAVGVPGAAALVIGKTLDVRGDKEGLYLVRGRYRLSAGDVRGARSDFLHAQRFARSPDESAVIHYEFANVALAENRLDVAAHELDETLRLAKPSWTYDIEAADVSLRRNRPEQARQLASRALGVAGDGNERGTAYQRRGQADLLLGDERRAGIDLTRAVKFSKDYTVLVPADATIAGLHLQP